MERLTTKIYNVKNKIIFTIFGKIKEYDKNILFTQVLYNINRN